MVVILGSLTLSCGRAIKKNPTDARNNFMQTQVASIPANSATTISQKNAAMLGLYQLNQAQCKGVSGPDAGNVDPIQLLDGYSESLVINNTDLTIIGSLGACKYQIQLGLAGITDQSVYLQVSSFHAYDNNMEVTGNLSTDSACAGVVSNLSAVSGLIQIDFKFDAGQHTFMLDYPVSAGSYCGDGNREMDTYAAR